jgi:hypothetical protein
MPVEILVSEPDRVLVVLIASFIGSDAAPVLLWPISHGRSPGAPQTCVSAGDNARAARSDHFLSVSGATLPTTPVAAIQTGLSVGVSLSNAIEIAFSRASTGSSMLGSACWHVLGATVIHSRDDEPRSAHRRERVDAESGR